MKNYKPHEYQDLFHKDRSPIRVCVAGRRGGKTLSCQIEDSYYVDHRASKCCHKMVINGMCSKCGQKLSLDQTEPMLGCIVLPKYDFIDDLYLPFFNDWLPAGSWTFNRRNSTLEMTRTGGKLFFESADDPTSVGHGKKYHFIHIEEARDIRRLAVAWDTLKPCLADYQGEMWTSTTPNGKDDVYKLFIQPAYTIVEPKDKMAETPQDPVKKQNLTGDKGISLFTWRTIDNPHISHERVLEDKVSMNPLMWRQEYFATIENYEGLVYPDFKASEFVKDIPTPNPDDRLYFVGLDVGWNHPTAGVLAVEDNNHEIHFLDEFKEQYLQPADIVDRLDKMLARNGIDWRRVTDWIIDPASRGTQQTSGMSTLDQINEEMYQRNWDCAFAPGNNDVMAGINRITRLLREKKISFSPRCVMLTQEYEVYHWPRWKDDSDGNRDTRPYKLGDDLCDASRYLIMSRPDLYEHIQRDAYGKVYHDPNEVDMSVGGDVYGQYDGDYDSSGVDMMN